MKMNHVHIFILLHAFDSINLAKRPQMLLSNVVAPTSNLAIRFMNLI